MIVVMQFVAGESLRALIDSHPQGVAAIETARITRDVAAALHRVHGCRGKGQPALVHCDLKPENILLATHIDTRSDIWSLGAILYELQTGKQPFIGSKDEIMEQIERYEPTAPKDLNTAVPALLENGAPVRLINRESQRRTP